MKVRKHAFFSLFSLMRKNLPKFRQKLNFGSQHYICTNLEKDNFLTITEDNNVLVFSYFEEGKCVYRSFSKLKYSFFKRVHFSFREEGGKNMSNEFFVKTLLPHINDLQKSLESY